MAASNVSSEAPNYPFASLYVGGLHPDVTEAMIFDKFASAGPVLSIRVCRDMITQRSLGYAYVTFQQPADAERALHTMNFDLVLGHRLRIMWSQRDPVLRKLGVGAVSIKNLDENIDNNALYDTFSAFGNILLCKIMTDENGQSKGFGFIHFETQEAADNAISEVNEMIFGNKKVYVARFTPHAGNGLRKWRNVFIKNFGDQLNEEQLCDLLSKYGKVSNLKIEKDENGHSKGFGFCSFENLEEAEKAVRNLNGYHVGDKELYLGHFRGKIERQLEKERKKELQRQERMNKYPSVNLYIKNLDDTIDDKRLREEFSKFGTVLIARVMSENGRSKGFGFVVFSKPDEAIKAITEMNGANLASKVLYVALAQRKEERRLHLTNQHMQRIATSRIPPQMLLPFPNGMGRMMSSLPTPVWPVQSTVGTRTTRNLPQNNTDEFSNSIIVPGQESLTLAGFADATTQEQKQMLRERLFSLIQQIQPDLVDKITDMLLEIDNTELLHILESRGSLEAKIEETIAVLQVHHANQLHTDQEAATNSDTS